MPEDTDYFPVDTRPTGAPRNKHKILPLISEDEMYLEEDSYNSLGVKIWDMKKNIIYNAEYD